MYFEDPRVVEGEEEISNGSHALLIKVLYVSLWRHNEPEDARISRTMNRDFVLVLKSVRHRRNNALCLKIGRVYVNDELGCSGKIVVLGLVPQWPKLKES